MSSIRFLEYGIVFIIVGLLNVTFGYWINIMLLIVGFVALIIGVLEFTRIREIAKP